jgi:hypothetical protein
MATQGRKSSIQDMFESLNLQSIGIIDIAVISIAFIFPSFIHFPGAMNKVVHAFKETIYSLGRGLLDRARTEDVTDDQGKSIIGILGISFYNHDDFKSNSLLV